MLKYRKMIITIFRSLFRTLFQTWFQ